VINSGGKRNPANADRSSAAEPCLVTVPACREPGTANATVPAGVAEHDRELTKWTCLVLTRPSKSPTTREELVIKRLLVAIGAAVCWSAPLLLTPRRHRGGVRERGGRCGHALALPLRSTSTRVLLTVRLRLHDHPLDAS